MLIEISFRDMSFFGKLKVCWRVLTNQVACTIEVYAREPQTFLQLPKELPRA